MSGAVPNQMNLSPLPPAVRATAKCIQFGPNNGSVFSSNNNNVIRIPLTSEGWLNGGESYLRFTVAPVIPANSCPVGFDGNASSIINRFRITSGGTVLCDINNYNVLMNLLLELQTSDDYMRQLSITSGATNQQYMTTQSIVPPINNINLTRGSNVMIAPGSVPAGLTNTGGGGPNNTPLWAGLPSTQTVSIPIIASILACNKYIPLNMLANALTLEIYLEPNFYEAFINVCDVVARAADANNNIGNTTTAILAQAVNVPTPGAFYQVSNIAYIANIITIQDPQIENMMRSMLASNGLSIHCDDWIVYQNSIPANTSNIVATIGDRSQNVKSFISVFKTQGTANGSGLNSYKYNVNAYQYRIGSTFIPVQPVQVSQSNLTEAFNEMCKCFNQNIFSVGVHTNTDAVSFGNDGATANWGSFAMCIDCESFQGGMESGINTSALQTSITLQASLNVPLPQQTGLLTFVHRDMILVIRGDGSVVVSV